MNWKIFVGLFLVGVAGVFFAYRIYNKPHLDVSEADADYILNLSTLMDEFEDNPNNAQNKYTDKVVVVSGTVADFQLGELTSIILDDGQGLLANCEMSVDSDLTKDQLENFLNSNEEVRLKGLFVGYEDLLGEVQLKKCSLAK